MRDLSSLLVTGGAGFIGSSLVRKLLTLNEVSRVVVLDKLADSSSGKNLTGLENDSRFTLAAGDINDSELVATLLHKYHITGILHLAAESDVTQSFDHTEAFVSTNVGGTSTLLDQARAASIPLLHCSSVSVYGSAPFPEKYSESTPLSPSTPYAATKASADLLVQAAHFSYGQDVIITRSTSCYGPRQRRNQLIPDIIFHALRDEPISILGSGRQIRDWMHVDDCAVGIIAAFVGGRSGAIYHLGANCEHTTLGIARIILKQLHKPQELITHIGDRPSNDDRQALDVRRALQLLRWKARIPFRSGFENTVRELAAQLRPESV